MNLEGRQIDTVSIRRKFGLVFMLVLMFAYTVQPLLQASAALAEGTYSVDYVIKKAEDESVSMANDYFEKPAQLTVSGGTVKVRLQLNHSEWITEFQVPGGNAKVVSSNKAADTRVVEFEIKDVEKPVIAKIHVTVPSIDYDHDYTIRFVFEAGKLKAISPVPAKKPAATSVPTKKPAATSAPAKKPAATPVPAKKPAATPAPTKKPAATPVPTKKPAATPVPTKKPAATSAPAKKPAATPVPAKKPTATSASAKKPAATPAPTKKPATASAPTTAPVVVAEEQAGPKLIPTLSSGATVLVTAAGYAVYRARKK
ncbi:heme uptake protein IsdC [Paenibacillus sp. NPDC057934]|uniref:heme uptake protein IsdC n=1 Tax=Paenibacillus sp. NPDC057934 TaxID=3346282 RepID=UPI0036DED107